MGFIIPGGEALLSACWRYRHHDATIIMMRTTVNLPDDVYEIARAVASARRVSLGQALAELIRRGFERKSRVREESGFPCFPVARNAPPITLEQTLNVEDEP